MKRNATPSSPPLQALHLQEYLPYRLSVLANTISAALAREYVERFELTIPQWRVMAVLGLEAGLSANEVGERTAMDKVTVSRAMAGLVQAGRVVRQVDREDRRRVRLRLSARGRTIYSEIVPRARALERELLSTLTPRDVTALDRLLDILSDRARQLGDSGREQAA